MSATNMKCALFKQSQASEYFIFYVVLYNSNLCWPTAWLLKLEKKGLPNVKAILTIKAYYKNIKIFKNVYNSLLYTFL